MRRPCDHRRSDHAAEPSHPAIGLLGDVMLGRGVGERLSFAAPERLWSPRLRELCKTLDLLICNLECCISAAGEPTELIAGKPFFFRAPPGAIQALTALGIGAVGLANNHALDFGDRALADTLRLLDAAKVAHAGAGRDRDTARHGAILTAGGRSVGLLAFSDHPREYAAGTNGWGIAYAPPSEQPADWVRAEIGRLRSRCEIVIAFPHWGPNMARRPDRRRRALARRLQEAGASLVAGHSAHVFHGVGWTAEGPVLYDLGGAIDDYRVDADLRNDLGVLAIWRPYAPVPDRLQLVGLRLEYAFTDLADGADADWIAARLQRACGELGTEVSRIAEQRFAISPQSPPHRP